MLDSGTCSLLTMGERSRESRKGLQIPEALLWRASRGSWNGACVLVCVSEQLAREQLTVETHLHCSVLLHRYCFLTLYFMRYV